MKISTSTLCDRMDLGVDAFLLIKKHFGVRFCLTQERFEKIVDLLLEKGFLSGYSPYEVLDKMSDRFSSRTWDRLGRLHNKLWDQYGCGPLKQHAQLAVTNCTVEHLKQSFPYIKKALAKR